MDVLRVEAKLPKLGEKVSNYGVCQLKVHHGHLIIGDILLVFSLVLRFGG